MTRQWTLRLSPDDTKPPLSLNDLLQAAYQRGYLDGYNAHATSAAVALHMYGGRP